MGQFGPHPHFSAFGAAVALGDASSWSCGSIFMGGFEVDVGGLASPSSTQTNFLTFFLLWVMGSKHEPVYFQVVEDFLFLGLLGQWELLWVVVWLCCWSWGGFGFGHYSHLISLCGISFLLLSVAFVSFLTWGLVWAGWV